MKDNISIKDNILKNYEDKIQDLKNKLELSVKNNDLKQFTKLSKKFLKLRKQFLNELEECDIYE